MPVCKQEPCTALSRFVGQENVVRSLAVGVRVAGKLGEPMGHTLLLGPPGVGKTALARAIAADLGARLHSVCGAFLRNRQVIVGLLTGLGSGDVLFIDGIQAVARRVAEVLREALTERHLNLPVVRGAFARTLELRLNPFTLIGATTDEGMLPHSLLESFEHIKHLDFYSAADLATIIRRAAAKEGIRIEDGAAAGLAKVARGTPREALHLLQHARDEALLSGEDVIGTGVVAAVLSRLGIDGQGLGPVDRAYLAILRARGPGRPLGLEHVAAILGETPRALERLHEPYLFRLGLASATSHGRIATFTPPAS